MQKAPAKLSETGDMLLPQEGNFPPCRTPASCGGFVRQGQILARPRGHRAASSMMLHMRTFCR
jgi:hypothetical protein